MTDQQLTVSLVGMGKYPMSAVEIAYLSRYQHCETILTTMLCSNVKAQGKCSLLMQQGRARGKMKRQPTVPCRIIEALSEHSSECNMKGAMARQQR